MSPSIPIRGLCLHSNNHNNHTGRVPCHLQNALTSIITGCAKKLPIKPVLERRGKGLQGKGTSLEWPKQENDQVVIRRNIGCSMSIHPGILSRYSNWRPEDGSVGVAHRHKFWSSDPSTRVNTGPPTCNTGTWEAEVGNLGSELLS